MKIGVVTMYLQMNYGGLLQAYALKTLLEDLGHDVTVFDIERKVWFPKPIKAPFIYVKRSLLKILKGNSGPEVFREYRLRKEYPIVSSKVSEFTQEYISPRVLKSYSDILKGEYDAFVVGSDQVWRPEYFQHIRDAFLKFTQGWDVTRLSYAASFGTDELEYEYELLSECSSLLSKFDAVSVRESSAVRMCDEWFDRDDAVHVLDPVMMQTRERYKEIVGQKCNPDAKGSVVTYILDRSPIKSRVADWVSEVTGRKICDVSVYPKDRFMPLSQRIVPPIEHWLSSFMDAEVVVTDSFHGCVLSILFHKPFLVVGNRSRGLARIDSLLGIFGLEHRLVDGIDPDDDGQGWLMDFDWDGIDKILCSQRELSRDFLQKALNVNGTSYPGEIEE